MPVLMTEEPVNGISVIHTCPPEAADRPLPTVIVLHSFGVSKELVSYFGYLAAQRGLRCLLPDAPLHGTRYDGRVRVRQKAFWRVVADYVAELEALRDAFRPLITNPDCVGIAGTSMGGFAALAETAEYSWVGATASFMGSAYFTRISRSLFPPMGTYDINTAADHERQLAVIPDPSASLDKLAGRPIYLWHGQRDDVVPFGHPLDMLADLRAIGGAGRLEVRIDPNGSHRVTDAAARDGIAFLARELDAGGHSL